MSETNFNLCRILARRAALDPGGMAKPLSEKDMTFVQFGVDYGAISTQEWFTVGTHTRNSFIKHLQDDEPEEGVNGGLAYQVPAALNLLSDKEHDIFSFEEEHESSEQRKAKAMLRGEIPILVDEEAWKVWMAKPDRDDWPSPKDSALARTISLAEEGHKNLSNIREKLVKEFRDKVMEGKEINEHEWNLITLGIFIIQCLTTNWLETGAGEEGEKHSEKYMLDKIDFPRNAGGIVEKEAELLEILVERTTGLDKETE